MQALMGALVLGRMVAQRWATPDAWWRCRTAHVTQWQHTYTHIQMAPRCNMHGTEGMSGRLAVHGELVAQSRRLVHVMKA